jgi:lambda repressor-like predicted transcriptional regulator
MATSSRLVSQELLPVAFGGEVGGIPQLTPGPQIPPATQSSIGAGHREGRAPELLGRVEPEGLTSPVALALLKAVQRDGSALVFVREQVQNHFDTVLAAVKQEGSALWLASPALKNNRAIVLAAVQQNGCALQNASRELQNDPAIVLAAVRQNGEALGYASRELRNDPAIVLAAVKKTGWAFQYASEELRNNRAIFLAAVQQDYKAIIYVSDDLRNDPDIVLAAVQADSRSLRYASRALQINSDFLLDAVKRNGLVLEYIPEERRTKEIVSEAVGENPKAIRLVPQAFIDYARANPDDPDTFPFLSVEDITQERAIKAVEKYPLFLWCVPPGIKEQLGPDFILSALQKNPMVLRYIPLEMQLTLEQHLFISAVKTNPKALSLIDRSLLTQLIVSAVIEISQERRKAGNQHPLDPYHRALRNLADAEMKSEVVELDIITVLAQYFNDDKVFMLYAITKGGVGLSVASDRLKDDEELVLEALGKLIETTSDLKMALSEFESASERLQRDPTNKIKALLQIAC